VKDADLPEHGFVSFRHFARIVRDPCVNFVHHPQGFNYLPGAGFLLPNGIVNFKDKFFRLTDPAGNFGKCVSRRIGVTDYFIDSRYNLLQFGTDLFFFFLGIFRQLADFVGH
jgi:hypothetical protein